jgi:hypothetical protein
MATGKLFLTIEISIIGSGLVTDKVGICTCVREAAADDLFDLTLM